MTAHVRAMAIFQGQTGLPQDRCINVFHFTGTGSYDATAALAAANVENFYTGTNTTAPIGAFLSPWLNRPFTINTYDLDQPVGERPPTVTAHTLPTSLSTEGYAEEVAVCLSYTSAVPITRRRRGRIYVGPLNIAAVQSGTTAHPARPQASIMSDLTEAALRLATYGGLAQWVIRSSKPAVNYVTIHQGWIDNALDTQRRRGPKSSARTGWTVTV